MKGMQELLGEFESIGRELDQQGQADLKLRLDEALSALRAQPDVEVADLITTGEAARALNVRSVNTVKRWAREGLLKGYRRGGRVLVSRRSIEDLLTRGELVKQQAFERDLAAALEPFDVNDACEADELEAAHAQAGGRKPWEQDAIART